MNHTPSIGLGVMSGTSLDGVDLALCSIDENLAASIIAFKTVPYSDQWRGKLETAHNLSALDFFKLQNDYTLHLSEIIKEFVGEVGTQPHYVSAHGHTIFHQPASGLTVQMLNGAMLSVLTSTVVVCDFRTSDVAAGGQGAPLVPIGDAILFREYAACVNIGGFANMSFDKGHERIAYDIAPANIVLNHLANQLGYAYDHNGEIARAGALIPELMTVLNSLSYYHENPPKSLGREWYELQILPLLTEYLEDIPGLLRTATEHIAIQIAASLSTLPPGGAILLTGGGAHNKYLVQALKRLLENKQEVVLPSKELIDAKEALIFALLGRLRIDAKANSLQSVTGANFDACGGAIYIPHPAC